MPRARAYDLVITHLAAEGAGNAASVEAGHGAASVFPAALTMAKAFRLTAATCLQWTTTVRVSPRSAAGAVERHDSTPLGSPPILDRSGALNFCRLEEIARLAELAASYWRRTTLFFRV
jgi:hypothetical protein